MHLIDPYGIGSNTPAEPAADAHADLSSPTHDAEVQLAASAPDVEVVSPGETASGSDLDPAMRLQDAPATWVESEADTAVPDAAPSDAGAEPYAPLQQSGDQGI
ncbi:MAG: hypothetical protein PVSMB4_02440 [Ktedonobacterales bacterium]